MRILWKKSWYFLSTYPYKITLNVFLLHILSVYCLKNKFKYELRNLKSFFNY